METTSRLYLGRYEAKELLGEGGMGRVYLAYQQDLKRKVVVKVMHDHVAQDQRFRDRFKSETHVMAQFTHPYAVTLYDASLDDPAGPCIIMEYIRGITLEKLLAQNKGQLTPARISRLLNQLCEVLQAAQEHRNASGQITPIIHRDLKPANIMVVDPDTPYEKIKVMDFGLAKLTLHGTGPKRGDSCGDLAVGTPAYMCPEQVRGDEMDHRGDLYSVGVILYELLTGRLPFQARDPMDVMLAHTTEAPPSFAEAGAPGCAPAAVEEVIRACLAKDPADRPATARELAQRYQQAVEQGDAQPEEAQAEEALEASARPPLPEESDPTVVVYRFEAWMPEAIAAYKLSGFVQDVGADVVENAPGKIRVRLGKPGTVYAGPGGAFAWLGFGKANTIDLELQMHPASSQKKGHLDLAVLMRSPQGELPSNPNWKARCDRVYTDLRAYLMGK